MPHGSNVVSELTDLPDDVFLLIISYLSPRDTVLCRRVNRAWNGTFGSDHVCRQLMRWHFPRAREMSTIQDARSWSDVLARLACRYFHLGCARPRQTEKIDIAGTGSSTRGVQPWDRRLSWFDSTATFQGPDAHWDLDDGLLIYQERASKKYIAYDLETGGRFPLPFDESNKIVRRLRFTHGLLIIEWCEREPCHRLNDHEAVHRHFATALDVRRPTTAVGWEISLRSEWKIHFLGLPLNNDDRFFSAHTATHYAIYLWQPNRSPWGEDNPLEQLKVYDISTSSPHRASEDPSGTLGSAHPGPAVIQTFTWRDLQFLGLRQGHTPTLRQILLDEGNVYLHAEDHRWLVGPHSSLSPPPHHQVRCTGIPFTRVGPAWFDECSADGDASMSFCPRAPSATAAVVDDARPGLAPCWRHEEFPYLTVSDVVDVGAGVRIAARQCFRMETLSAVAVAFGSTVRESDLEGGEEEDEEEEGDQQGNSEVRFSDEVWRQLLGKGKIAGDERWLVGEDGDDQITILRF